MNQILTIFILLIIMGMGVSCQAQITPNPVQTVDNVDLERYLGVWYQQSFFPFRFQRADCGELVTAEYSLNPKGKINVVNTCYADKDGREIKAQRKATAWTVDETNAKLKVQFFWPIKADYWIVKLDQANYKYTVVSESTREYLWILTREKTVDRVLYDEIVNWLKDNGWDTSKLVFTGSFK